MSVGDSVEGMVFKDREDAGTRLAARLSEGHDLGDAVVLGLPRGGVPVASRVADRLGLPLDVIVVRKLGVPSQPEVAMGAIGEGGAEVLDAGIVRMLGIAARDVAAVERRERTTLELRLRRLRHGRRRVPLEGRTALIVDDGIATGATAEAAAQVARELGARRVFVAAPVAGPGAAGRIVSADAVIALSQPPGFQAVGACYEDFGQTSDEEVMRILEAARARGLGHDAT